MNKAAILLCQGDLNSAKDTLDELLVDQNLKVVHTETSTDQDLIPDYLVNLLVYFLIISSKSCVYFNDAAPVPTHLSAVAHGLYFLCDNRELQDGKALDQVPSLRA